MGFHVVFDMDGTLSDPSHRVHHLEKKDWDAFYEACAGDTPILPMIETLRAHQFAGHTVQIWTGRRESTRQKTLDWLGQFEIDSVEIFMRADGDFRHDTEIKGEWLREVGKPDLVYEDRNSMVDFYRSQNIICLQVAPGDF